MKFIKFLVLTLSLFGLLPNDFSSDAEDARKNRDDIERKMTPSQLEKAQELSKVYYEKYVKPL